MKTFTLSLQSTTQFETVEKVSDFVGEDLSGSFGIRAGHERMLTSLVFGLARFRVGNGPWEFLALPGAMLYFVDNTLKLTTRHYLRDADYARISAALEAELLDEEEHLHDMKQSLHRMEEEMLKRLSHLGRHGEAGR